VACIGLTRLRSRWRGNQGGQQRRRPSPRASTSRQHWASTAEDTPCSPEPAPRTIIPKQQRQGAWPLQRCPPPCAQCVTTPALPQPRPAPSRGRLGADGSGQKAIAVTSSTTGSDAGQQGFGLSQGPSGTGGSAGTGIKPAAASKRHPAAWPANGAGQRSNLSQGPAGRGEEVVSSRAAWA